MGRVARIIVNRSTMFAYSQPRHDQWALTSHKPSLRVQGVAPARRKVQETSRNGFLPPPRAVAQEQRTVSCRKKEKN
jgi:hypothetical protein